MTTSQNSLPTQLTTGLFSDEQWRHIQSLLGELDERQSLWLSGFLAARQQTKAAPVVSPSNEARVWITFGSETGNCESLARRLGESLAEQRIAHQVMSLADVKPRALSRVDYLFVICSTHGDGDPPEPATVFYEQLMSDQAPRLTDTQFAVLALGDSSYEHFCTTGKAIDDRLEHLGARRLVERIDCDVDFEQPARQWMTQVLESAPRREAVQPAAPANTADVFAAPAQTTAPTRQNPLLVEVLDNVRLSSDKRKKAIHHLELLFEPGKLQLTPGDAVGVLPHNAPALVAAVLDAGGFSGDEPVTINERAMPLVEALREHLDLTIPGAAFLKTWAEASDSAELRQHSEADGKAQRQFLRSLQIVDVLRAHPGATSAQAFVDCLRPLQPRLYDVANNLEPDMDELHLTVKDFRYPMNGRELAGTASQYLLQLQPGENLRIYPHHNKRFHLPDQKEAPLILVANGTGIAPFRAFIQSLGREGRNHACWLVFQEACAEEDFLYQLDLQQAAAQGVLQHVDTLFTEDEPSRQLGDLFRERADRLLDWLARGAHLYICGEKELLSHCEDNLKLLCDQSGHGTAWTELTRDKRIHRNLY